jgi:secreted trypsin-like serine protease
MSGQQVGIVSWSIKACAVDPYPRVFTRGSQNGKLVCSDLQTIVNLFFDQANTASSDCGRNFLTSISVSITVMI